MKLSFVVPIFNEAESLPEFFERLYDVIASEKYQYEIIAVDDGSRDATFKVLAEHAERDPHLRVIRFERNAGQTAALRAGIDHARGDVIIPLDSDLENDPTDVPRLIAKLGEGFDVVSGWRQNRWNGKYLSRKLPSDTANALISWITGTSLHDYGCTLKAYRREVIQGVVLYGEMHRFIPAYASWYGARVTEIPVHYTDRKFGKSNYGISRTFRVLLDLLMIKFFEKYRDRPIHFFGAFGFLFLFLGGLALVLALSFRFFIGISLIQTPLPTLAGLLASMGVNFILIGVVAEMLVRQKYEEGEVVPYRIRESLNLVHKK